MKFKIYNILVIFLFLVSCTTVKSGFVNSKKVNSDEFLVEKKMPLKMPPAYNELPKPGRTSQENEEKNNEIKSLITNKDNNELNQSEKQAVNKNLKDTLLKKIKEN